MAAHYTGQINFLGGRLLHDTSVRWLGTYARDQIPQLKHERRPYALVINKDEGSKPGEHWLALYAPCDSTKIEMFDSFGLPPNCYGLDNSLSCKILFSSRSIQELSTKVCGHYALLFIYHRSRGHSFDKTINMLEKNYTDASGARKMLDLSLSKLSHVHCIVQSCKINLDTATFELYYYGELSQRAINRHIKCEETLVLYPIEFYLSHLRVLVLACLTLSSNASLVSLQTAPHSQLDLTNFSCLLAPLLVFACALSATLMEAPSHYDEADQSETCHFHKQT